MGGDDNNNGIFLSLHWKCIQLSKQAYTLAVPFFAVHKKASRWEKSQNHTALTAAFLNSLIDLLFLVPILHIWTVPIVLFTFFFFFFFSLLNCIILIFFLLFSK